MKKFIAIVLFAGLYGTVSAQSKTVLKDFGTRFSGVTAKWTQTKAGWQGTFSSGENMVTAIYDDTDTWLMTETTYEVTSISKTLMDKITQKTPDFVASAALTVKHRTDGDYFNITGSTTKAGVYNICIKADGTILRQGRGVR